MRRTTILMTVPLAVSALTPGCALDLGCGDGTTAIPEARLGAVVTGVDIARNLVPARKLGITTVWLKTDSPWGKHGPLMDVAPGDIEHETDNLTQFLNTIRI